MHAHDGKENHRYWLDGDTIKSEPVSEETLAALREEAMNYWPPAMRSCWECNRAHIHFLDEPWGEWVCACIMGCGRYYYKGVDITDYSEDDDDQEDD